jgi:hypothetical protein
MRIRAFGRIHYPISKCACCAFSVQYLSIVYRAVKGVSFLLYGVILCGGHKVSTVEELV